MWFKIQAVLSYYFAWYSVIFKSIRLPKNLLLGLYLGLAKYNHSILLILLEFLSKFLRFLMHSFPYYLKNNKFIVVTQMFSFSKYINEVQSGLFNFHRRSVTGPDWKITSSQA